MCRDAACPGEFGWFVAYPITAAAVERWLKEPHEVTEHAGYTEHRWRDGRYHRHRTAPAAAPAAPGGSGHGG